jgi:ligand-binding sensor domain-containing protein
MANKLHIVFLLIVFSYLIISNIFLPLHAQFVEPKFDEITPVIMPMCVFQDSYGFIWIGDQAGLIKYDDITMVIINQNNLIPQ